MSRLRRTGTGDLRPPYLGPYPDTTSQIRGPHLTCPGTSSSGTALFSSPLGGDEGVHPFARHELVDALRVRLAVEHHRGPAVAQRDHEGRPHGRPRLAGVDEHPL